MRRMSILGAATITSPAVMSAIRITPSSITRDSALMMSLSSASASVSISSARESGPGWMNSASFWKKPRLSSCRRLRCGPVLGGLSDTEGKTWLRQRQRIPHTRPSGPAAQRGGSAPNALARLAHALADLLHQRQRLPELVRLGLEVVIGHGQLLVEHFGHAR